MIEYNYFDETFDSNQSNSYILSIQLSLDGFSFCVFDEIAGKYIALGNKEFPEKFQTSDFFKFFDNFIKKETWITSKFKKVNCLLDSSMYTLIPEESFEESNLKKYLEFNHSISEIDEIHYNKIDLLNTYNVFSVSSDITNYLNRYFTNINYINRQSVAISNILASNKTMSGNNVFVNLGKSVIDIIVLSNKKLVMCNSFKFKSNTDALYHILNVFDKFRLSTLLTEIYLSGRVHKESDFYQLAIQYLGKIKLNKPNQNYAYSYLFKNIEDYQFLNLINSIQCAL